MLLNNRLSLGVALLVAGCAGGGGGGYDGAPRIAAPSAQAIDAPYPSADQDYPAAQPDYRSAQAAPDPTLQAEYPPEPGAAVGYDPVGNGDALPPPRQVPGAGYDRPGTAYRRAPAAPIQAVPIPADVPPAIAAAAGPRGTSGEQQRYDAVGYASWYGEEMAGTTSSGRPFDASGITAAHRTLPLGSVVEVTALDTGRTILVLINDRGPGGRDREIDLSRGAAQQLGLNAVAPVRVRLVNASPQDQMALRSGQAAAARMDAPPTLLAALRRKLPPRTAPRAAPVADYGSPATRVPAPRTDMRAPQTAGIFVQVAALSSEQRAQALASSLGGRVARVGSIYRVQIGPFANAASAQRARDDVARRGYGDARIVTTN